MMQEGDRARPLKGRVALITGAAGDIGHAAAVQLSREGARIVAIDQRACTALASELGDALALAIEIDCSSETEIASAVARTIALTGRIDILFNNAGVEGPTASVPDYPLAEFERVLHTNVVGVFLGMKHVIPHMVERGGVIINTSSTAGLAGAPQLAAYVASKHAVVGLTRSAASEWAHKGIRINCINPGPVEGRMMQAITRGLSRDDEVAKRAAVAARIPAGRYANVDEIAAAVSFLASDAAAFIHGICLPIDGGRTAV